MLWLLPSCCGIWICVIFLWLLLWCCGFCICFLTFVFVLQLFVGVLWHLYLCHSYCVHVVLFCNSSGSNRPPQPCSVYSVFSILGDCMASQIHLLQVGGLWFFQLERMRGLDWSFEWAMQFNCSIVRVTSPNSTSKRPRKGHGSIIRPVISKNTSNIADQNNGRLGHDQNEWWRLAGACLHLSRVRLVSKIM